MHVTRRAATRRRLIPAGIGATAVALGVLPIVMPPTANALNQYRYEVCLKSTENHYDSSYNSRVDFCCAAVGGVVVVYGEGSGQNGKHDCVDYDFDSDTKPSPFNPSLMPRADRRP